MRIRKYAAAAVMTVALSGVVAFATPAVASPPAGTTTAAGEVSPMNSCKKENYAKAIYHYNLADRLRKLGHLREAAEQEIIGDHYMSLYRSCKG
ncbi:hypothetical protein FB566_2156 [Stackebrandtia endophytica]|uniref:Uncharacterized protein n=1 Tax=Stackebrandtia endophytica TaxID=1496996 RepID=A0A543AVL1_9ACTN|nr:hypothetical protein [Stackebrandtia endophytica]TQL76623.1 hypothetical protein FB566_2156 [Stackebrandtia endophytica]